MEAPAFMESTLEYHPLYVEILTMHLESGVGTLSGG